jgi:Rrf2 family protein
LKLLIPEFMVDISCVMYGKQTERAIAALSRLAEVWDGGRTRLSSVDIADNRGLPRPMVAKLLTTLSQGGLVNGSPGPGGGYALARPPKEINFRQVHDLFERPDNSRNCPFGGGVCGGGAPCPMHDRLVQMQSEFSRYLNETTFECFRVAAQDQGHKPSTAAEHPERPRESWRAPLTRKTG